MRYKNWINIRVKHAYFGQKRKCGVELIPTPETSLLLKKADVLWRKQDSITWILIKSNPEKNEVDRVSLLLAEEECKLEFHIKPLVNTFDYFTHIEKQEGDCWMLIRNEKSLMDKYFLQIFTNKQLIKETIKIQLYLQSKEAVWEFILIPKFTDRNAIIELQESNRKLSFTVPERFNQPGEDFAYKCKTEETIAMKELYDYQISLKEKKINGERILNSNITFPKPETASVSMGKYILTSYIYY